MRRSGVRWVGLGVWALLLAGCSAIGDVLGGGEPVFDTGIDPVELAFDGPTLMAVDGRTLVVRSGDAVSRVRRGQATGWLPTGDALVSVQARVRLVVPGSEPSGPSYAAWYDPSRAVTQVNVLRGFSPNDRVLRTYDLSLSPTGRHELDAMEGRGTHGELARNYYGAVPTIDGTTFVKWHDSSEHEEDNGDYGVLMVSADGTQANVLPNSNVVGLYLSADGTGLLGLRQVRGEPCGGCVVDQDIVEIDPATGEIAAEYGVPEPYSEDWRVAGMDKVGDRVAVRYYEPVSHPDGTFTHEQRGTWVYDGAWTMLPGSEEELTWWQGSGRVVARVNEAEKKRGDGFDLFWVSSSGDETPLDHELGAMPSGVPTTGEVAGQYLPPDD